MLRKLVVALLLIGAVIAAWWWYEHSFTIDVDSDLPPVVAPVEESERQTVRHPLPEPRPEAAPEPDTEESGPTPEPLPSLPPLDESDGFVIASLHEHFGEDELERWLVEEHIVERAVVFVNSLDGPSVPMRMRPLRPLPSDPVIGEDNDRLYWARDNAPRYEPLVSLMESSDPAAMARMYIRQYRLFQEAHEALGHDESHFNDRLVDIIDHLLTAPRPEGPFRVERYEDRYRFADDELEAESFGRKALMRLGPDNAETVRGWLREFRRHIADD